MKTRKSMTFPVILTFIIIAIIVYLFATIKQSQVVCVKNTSFDSDIQLNEQITSTVDGKKVTSIQVVKTIILPAKYTQDDTQLNSIRYALENTLEYLENHVKYTIQEDRVIVKISVDKDEIVLLNNNNHQFNIF